jgi:hypothetical protein
MICRIVASAALAALAFTGASHAGACPGRPEALGTARVIALDLSEHRKLGLMEYEETLPLQDREVVLTFDDGPIPPSTPKVLDALAAECVKATFFVVGEMARAHPALVRREFREATPSEPYQHHPISTASPAKPPPRDFGRHRVGEQGFRRTARGPFFRFYLETRVARTRWRLSSKHRLEHRHPRQRLEPPGPGRIAGLAMQRLGRNKKGISCC